MRRGYGYGFVAAAVLGSAWLLADTTRASDGLGGPIAVGGPAATAGPMSVTGPAVTAGPVATTGPAAAAGPVATAGPAAAAGPAVMGGAAVVQGTAVVGDPTLANVLAGIGNPNFVGSPAAQVAPTAVANGSGYLRAAGRSFGPEYAIGGRHPYSGFDAGPAFSGFSGVHSFNGFRANMREIPAFLPPVYAGRRTVPGGRTGVGPAFVAPY